jgi:hypothetical protein
MSERVLYGGQTFYAQGKNQLFVFSFSISGIAKLLQGIPIRIVF